MLPNPLEIVAGEVGATRVDFDKLGVCKVTY
jgi:hypothetical protein